MTAIAIFGAAGRMGRSMAENLTDFPSLRLAAAVEAPGHPALGRDAGEVAGTAALGVPVGTVMSRLHNGKAQLAALLPDSLRESP